MARIKKEQLFIAIYLVGFLVSLVLFGRDAIVCRKLRWPTLPTTGVDVAMATFIPAIGWPLFLPASWVAASENKGHICATGGKWQEEPFRLCPR